LLHRRARLARQHRQAPRAACDVRPDTGRDRAPARPDRPGHRREDAGRDRGVYRRRDRRGEERHRADAEEGRLVGAGGTRGGGGAGRSVQPPRWPREMLVFSSTPAITCDDRNRRVITPASSTREPGVIGAAWPGATGTPSTVVPWLDTARSM